MRRRQFRCSKKVQETPGGSPSEPLKWYWHGMAELQGKTQVYLSCEPTSLCKCGMYRSAWEDSFESSQSYFAMTPLRAVTPRSPSNGFTIRSVSIKKNPRADVSPKRARSAGIPVQVTARSRSMHSLAFALITSHLDSLASEIERVSTVRSSLLMSSSAS